MYYLLYYNLFILSIININELGTLMYSEFLPSLCFRVFDMSHTKMFCTFYLKTKNWVYSILFYSQVLC